jgi:ATP-binding cassette subfamily F protein 3
LSYGRKVLFEDASFAISRDDRVGLVGANGTGKSTLLKILSGVVTPDGGTVNWVKGAQVGYLPQEIAAPAVGSVLESVMSAVPGRERLQARHAALEASLGKVTGEAEALELSQALADLLEELDHFDDRHGKHVAEKILHGLGFTPDDLAKPLAALSGGWRMRAALAGLLLQGPDQLLLDEPTNHLDLPTLTWFDDFLRRSRKALVLISHDREFLNRQINRVLSLEVEGLRSYAGNYERYRAQRAVEAEQLEAQAARQQARKAELTGFIERFGAKASTAKAA